MSIKKIVGVFIVVVILALASISGYLYFNGSKIAEEILRDRIINDYNQNPETKYLISLEKIKLNILNGSVDLINISVVPKDSLVTYKPGIDQRPITNTSLVIHIGKVTLEEFDYVQALSGRTIDVKRFEINQPQVEVFKHLGITDTTATENQDTVDFKGVFITHYDTFKLAEVDIINASSTYYQVSEDLDTFKVLTVNHLNYQITEILITENTMRGAPFIAYKEYNLNSENLQVVLHNNSEINIKSFQFESESQQLTITGASIIPTVSPQQFFKKQKFRKGWIKLEVEKIQINDFDYRAWLTSNHIKIGEIQVTNPVLDVKTNSNLPFSPEDNKPMLGQLLTRIPIGYVVDKVDITGAQINLDIIGKKSSQHGLLSFGQMNIHANNLTNMKSHLDSSSILDIKVDTRINKMGDIKAYLAIDLAHPKSATKFNVIAKNLNLKKFNSILKPIVGVEIVSGKMVSLKMSSTLNSNGGNGTLNAHYTNLKLQILAKESKKQKNFLLNVVSGLANGYIRNNSIPDQPGYHPGKFQFTKDRTDSFFKMLWMCHLFGLEDAVIGSNKKDTRQAKKKAKEKNPKKRKKKTKK